MTFVWIFIFSWISNSLPKGGSVISLLVFSGKEPARVQASPLPVSLPPWPNGVNPPARILPARLPAIQPAWLPASKKHHTIPETDIFPFQPTHSLGSRDPAGALWLLGCHPTQTPYPLPPLPLASGVIFCRLALLSWYSKSLSVIR